MNFAKLSAVKMGHASGGFVFILHPLFHLWTALHPQSYVYMLKLFLPGIQPVVTPFDYSVTNTIIATLTKALAFWVIGFAVASFYNLLLTNKK